MIQFGLYIPRGERDEGKYRPFPLRRMQACLFL